MSTRLKQLSMVILIVSSLSYFHTKLNGYHANAETTKDSTVKLLIMEKAETKEERLEIRFNSAMELPKTYGVENRWNLISGFVLIIVASRLINKNKEFRRKIK